MNRRTARYRDDYRQQSIPNWYSGWVHFGVLIAAVALLLAACASQLSAVRPWEWVVIPFSFLFANLAEYLVHRHPMHRALPGRLRYIFERHAGMHHRYYTHEDMQIDSHRDLATVLFPLHLFFVFFGVIAAPMALLLGTVISVNAGLLFMITAAAYYQIYEFLHVSYHLDPDGVVGRLPGMAFLRRAHTLHHDPRQMARVNFNISFPIVDQVLGTFVSGEEMPKGQRKAS